MIRCDFDANMADYVAGTRTVKGEPVERRLAAILAANVAG
jgi:hypothetical protein